MNANTLPPEILERLARLVRMPDFAVLADVIRDELAGVTDEAIKTADPRWCGHAQALMRLLNLFDDIPTAFEARQIAAQHAFSSREHP